MFRIRKFLWRILGIDYSSFLRKIDYGFLTDDRFSKIGFKTYENGAVVVRSGDAEIVIGNYCSIAQATTFIVDGGNHTFSEVCSFPLFDSLFAATELDKNQFKGGFKQKQGISLGHDVWIGSGAYIMPGVKIGNGVTVAANSVVTKNIPDYAVVAGVPAKIVKMKCDEESSRKLNRIAWWNWDEKVIKERVNDFYVLKLEDFIKKYYEE